MTARGQPGATGIAARSSAPPRLRSEALGNLLRMGHCAPSLVKTLEDAAGDDASWLVRLAAALPGMANTGNECGGLTGPLVVIGLRHARDPDIDGVPAPVFRGRALLDSFLADHGTTCCRDILRNARVPLRCLGVVARAPQRALDVEAGTREASLAPDRRAAHRALCAHFADRGFHCTQAVLHASADPEAASPQVLAAASPFLGGTALGGLTCGALTGGLLLLGRSLGQIEDSRLRVLRMLATMAVRGDALADERNAFNRAMNRGHDLARWFAGRFGSTQCRELTACDFATPEGVQRYTEKGGVASCRAMATEVAARADALVERTRREAAP